jgi:SAM-dependent methyltransferase
MEAPSKRDEIVQQHFDRNTARYVELYRDTYLQTCLKRLFPLKDYSSVPQRPSLLDVGGGGGIFSDVFLRLFPGGTACCLDMSEKMLRSNRQDPRKMLVVATAKSIPLRSAAFDLINVDCLMHHMVDSSGYNGTIRGIQEFLNKLRGHLRPGGMILVREIYHESPILDNFSARLLFSLSMTELPQIFCQTLNRVGMHTANAGVCFLTRSQWKKAVSDCGYNVRSLIVNPWRSVKFKALGFWNSGELHYVLTA